jgi:hypothetical protein
MFGGETFDAERDGQRLENQLGRVRQFMLDGEWRTLGEIVMHCGGTEASVSARLRDLRKQKFGLYQIERKYFARGIHKYRLLPPLPVVTRDPEALPTEEIAHQIVLDFLAR